MRTTTSGMKVAFFTPYYKEARGNATTAKRLIAGIEENGIQIERFVYEEEQFTKADEKRLAQCDLIHIIHFGRFSLWQKKLSYRLTKPYVLTSGGTDINFDIYDEKRRDTLEELLAGASAITVYSQDGKEKLINAFSFLNEKVFVIPSSFWLPSDKHQKKGKILDDSRPQVLLPAGLRQVKDVLFLIPGLNKLREHFPTLTFSIVGTIIEEEVYKEVQQACKKYEWVHFYHELPLEKMAQVYAESDIVVNSSISEGQSGAIVEALFLKKPVLARRIRGNETLIADGVNGLLFETNEEFIEKFQMLMNDKAFRDKIIKNGDMVINKEHSFEKEIKSYMDVYKCTSLTNSL